MNVTATEPTTVNVDRMLLECENDWASHLETLRDHITVSAEGHTLLAKCAGRTVRFRTRPGTFVASVDILKGPAQFSQLGNITNLQKRPYLKFSKGPHVIVICSEDRRVLRASGIAFWCAVQEFSAEVRSQPQVASS
ncbi:hypothetical protein [Natronoglycomyces albus]|uniref:Uncharacterized protein n=1 Tax=Natronoglycomyces albus TaxID=2811108 RepID=A0A895XVG7_9ACTN|nr:hypothetical protein [Natronoglycomyces albus]QSB06516.1 hypothetical protein JQS30_06325 [Natronoglycomyces albus]